MEEKNSTQNKRVEKTKQNKTKQIENKKAEKKKKSFLKKTFNFLITLILIFLIVITYVAYNPRVLVPTIIKKLKQQNIHLEVYSIKSTPSFTNFKLSSSFKIIDRNHNIEAENANALIEVNLVNLLKNKPFINTIKLNSANININDFNKTIADLKDAFKRTDTSSQKGFEKYLPKNWKVQNLVIKSKIQTEENQIKITANGKDFSSLNAKVLLNEIDEIDINYNKERNVFSLNSKIIKLDKLVGYQASLNNLNLFVDLKNTENSKLNTDVLYKEIKSNIKLIGDDKNLKLQITSKEKNVKIIINPIKDNFKNGFSINLNKFDISILEQIKPLLPPQVKIDSISGFVSGDIIFKTSKNNITAKNFNSSKLKVENFSISSEFLTIQNLGLSADITDFIINYSLILDKTNTLIKVIYNHRENLISGNISGKVNLKKQIAYIDNVNLSNQDLEKMTAKGEFYFSKKLILNLKGSLLNADATKVYSYLPKQLPKSVLLYLKGSLLSGKNNKTSFHLNGDITKWYKDKDFILNIDSEVRDTKFRYLPDDPEITINSGKVKLRTWALEISSDDSKINNVPVENINVSIPNFESPLILVKTNIKSQDSKKIIKTVLKTIAKEQAKPIFKMFNLKGKFSIDLDLTLDLEKEKYPFALNISSKQASGIFKEIPNLKLTRINSTIKINEKGLVSGKIKAKLFKKDIKINLTKASKKGNKLKININSKFNPNQILSNLSFISKYSANKIKKTGLFSGQSFFDINLLIDTNRGGKLLNLDLKSNLVGTSLNIFDAITKPSGKKLRLNLNYNFAKNKINFNLKNKLKIEVGLHKNGEFKDILVNTTKTKYTYKRNKIRVFANIRNFSYVRYLMFVDALSNLSKSKRKSRHKITTNIDLGLSAKKVILANTILRNLKIKGSGSEFSLKSDTLNADIKVDKKNIIAKVEQVKLDKLISFYKQNQSSGSSDGTRIFKNLPHIQIIIDKIFYKGKFVGEASLYTSAKNGLYSIDNLIINNDDYFFQLNGFEKSRNGKITTRAEIDFKSKKLSRLIKLFSLNNVANADFVDISANISWRGKFLDFNFNNLNGSAKLDIQYLKMLNLKTGGAGVLGLLDVASLVKRISLDFSSLSSSKLTFDKIKGRWNIKNSIAKISKFKAEGGLAVIRAKGGFDIKHKNFKKLQLTVSPKISNALPVIGAGVGGFVGAAAALVVQQAIGDKLDKGIGTKYNITGTWLDPIIKKK